MFKKLFAALGVKSKVRADAPYGTAELNAVHNMLFADDAGSLFGDAPDPRVVQGIAQDATEESRVRLLAAQWLRDHGHQPAAPDMLGVIIEVPLDKGMDTLAAYADGRVRYIDQHGHTAVFEGAPSNIADQAKTLVATAIAACAVAGRQKPVYAPAEGRMRITFLEQNGNRMMEGLFTNIMRDELAKPVLEQGRALLDLVAKPESA
ncbi:hypothetical protein [Pseudoduganella sp. OTU4001]|uniref:hypothetical protein n=1 Tax=Pseudoduganella sp. OTU4001 TaxID=3043854 RepID=UPI00313B32CB